MIVKLIIALVLYDLAKFIVRVVAMAIVKTTRNESVKETVKKTWDERLAEMQAQRNKL